jgi:hypothetical protein
MLYNLVQLISIVVSKMAFEKFEKYGRILDLDSDLIWKRKVWSDSLLDRNLLDFNRCHWGQLKLFYTELEFLTLCMERDYKMEECVCVYI